MRRKAKPLRERFDSFLPQPLPHSFACWVWQGYCGPKGYGTIANTKGQLPAMLRTHRLAWEFANGRPVPQGLQVLHDCDNPPCCNPSHLFLGTNADNNADMMSKGRNRVSRGSRNRTAANKVADVIRLRASGVASEAIADRLLIHRSTVDRILQNQK